MNLTLDDLTGAEIIALIGEHLQNMSLLSPLESMHALNLEGLKKPGVTIWSAWKEDELVGCGTLKELDNQHGEIKSMRTALAHRRKGVSRRILQHIIEETKQRGYKRISLEMGSMDAFQPARRLYESFGFQYYKPFSDYIEDPNSVFMTKKI
ncbi:GNAT family N-acetyltransferase [Seinonella peptonophila]|uniref:GNAT family N-acetyltransferase n=1 Tax=Seinonella peptonophila TaxID=112248 RepID=UPI000934956A|nr:GNAT family N-acetyltransferase [Seinonella peptonophila]